MKAVLGIAGNSDPIWQAILPRLFHHMLIFYDDRATVEKYYPVVKAYIDYLLQGVDERGVLITPGHDYGDWVAPIGCDDAWNKANSACSSRTDGRTHCPECGENGTPCVCRFRGSGRRSAAGSTQHSVEVGRR